jgi:hypothetical protein
MENVFKYKEWKMSLNTKKTKVKFFTKSGRYHNLQMKFFSADILFISFFKNRSRFFLNFLWEKYPKMSEPYTRTGLTVWLKICSNVLTPVKTFF